jgi:hypothetical protein
LAFCYSTHGGITAHLRYRLHIHRYKQHFRSQIGRRGGSLTASMAGAYNDYVVFGKHKGRKGILYFQIRKKKLRSVSRETLTKIAGQIKVFPAPDTSALAFCLVLVPTNMQYSVKDDPMKFIFE